MQRVTCDSYRCEDRTQASHMDAIQVIKKARMRHIHFVYPKMERRSMKKYSRYCETRVVIIMTRSA